MLKNTAFLVLGVPLLVLGLPVGEVTYAAIYAFGRGRGEIEFRQRWELPHETLMRYGMEPARVLILFQLATLYLCLLAFVLALLVRISFLVKLGLLLLGLLPGALIFFVLVRLWTEPKETDDETVDMLGVPLARLNMERALERVEQFINERSPHLVITSDTPSIVRAQDDLEYQEIIRSAAMVTADGRGVVWMARLLGLPMRDRVSGVDLVLRICELAVARGYAVYLLGAAPGVAEEAAQALQTRCPGLRIAGTQHGYFTLEEEPGIVRRIAELRPEVLFVALGAPRQEQWIRKHMEELQVPVAIGVGGSFDVFAGRVQRAPEWMQKAGLEWLYRVLREPKRLPRMWAVPRFVLMTLWEALRRR
jgi:N-acetylglucosaminyldiphosphoundecaprenol N-acetyl-beta-D-mannosaminyltransferase